jgi:hypothetical protein
MRGLIRTLTAALNGLNTITAAASPPPGPLRAGTRFPIGSPARERSGKSDS